MQTMIINHYPPVISQIREMKQIAKAEDVEFRKLRAQVEAAEKNMFILSADESGISRFEHILGIRVKAGQSLDERKIIAMAMSNRRKMSLRELAAMLSTYAKGTELLKDIDNMELVIALHTDIENLKPIYQIVDEIVPLIIQLVFAHISKCYIPVRHKNSIRFRLSFYPRYNLPQLKLDREWKLNGGRKLSGYDSQETVDFYPVSIRFQAGAAVIPEEKTRIYLPFRAGKENDIRTGSTITIKTSAKGGVESKEQVGIRAAAAHAMGVGDIRIYNKNQLGGGWKLNGSRKLNGGTEIR